MSGRLMILVGCALMFIASSFTEAREKRIGLFNSPKGLGLSLQVDNRNGDEIRCFNVYADCYGVFSARTSDLGLAASFTHNYIFGVYDYEHLRLSVYGGAGVLMGYVHDYEKGLFSRDEQTRVLSRDMGFSACLDCNAGLGLDFDRGITVDLSLSLCPGIIIRRDRYTGSALVSLYKLGIFNVWMPQLCLYYRF